MKTDSSEYLIKAMDHLSRKMHRGTREMPRTTFSGSMNPPKPICDTQKPRLFAHEEIALDTLHDGEEDGP